MSLITVDYSRIEKLIEKAQPILNSSIETTLMTPVKEPVLYLFAFGHNFACIDNAKDEGLEFRTKMDQKATLVDRSRMYEYVRRNQADASKIETLAVVAEQWIGGQPRIQLLQDLADLFSGPNPENDPLRAPVFTFVQNRIALAQKGMFDPFSL